MNILITGGSGYVGSMLANYLMFLGNNVTVFDTMTYGMNFIQHEVHGKKINVIKEDIRLAMPSDFKNIDAVIHLAGISNDPTGELDPKVTESVNVYGTHRLLDTAQKAGVSKFIFASSSSVYGISESLCYEEDIPNPITEYSKSKLEAEQYVLKHKGSMQTVVIRPATICGRSARLRLDLAVNAMTSSAFFDGKIRVNYGKQHRPHVSMETIISIYKKFLTEDMPNSNREIYNAGWNTETIYETAVRIKKLTDEFYRPYDKKETEILINSNAVDHRDYRVCSEKIEKTLSFPNDPWIDTMIYDLLIDFYYGRVKDPNDPIYYNLEVLKNDGSMSRNI